MAYDYNQVNRERNKQWLVDLGMGVDLYLWALKSSCVTRGMTSKECNLAMK